MAAESVVPENERRPVVLPWELIVGCTLAYVLLGQMVSFVPNPIVPDAVLALNMTLPVIAGYFGGPLAGALVGALGTLLNFVVRVPLVGPDYYELAAIPPHTLMGAAAGWVGQTRSRIGTAATILIGHLANILMFLCTGLLSMRLVLTANFWTGLLAETAVDLILVALAIRALERVLAPPRSPDRYKAGPHERWFKVSALVVLSGFLALGFLEDAVLAGYLFVLPVVLAAVLFGPLEAWFAAVILSLPLGASAVRIGLGQAAPELSLILVLNLVALAVGELAGNLQDQRRLAQQRADELAAAYEVLNDSDRLKASMIQNVAHELRTPLAIIIGYTELLSGGEMGEFEPQQARALQTILDHGRRLEYVVDQITILHQVEEGKLVREPLMLGMLTRGRLDKFRRWGHEGTHDLRLEVGGEPYWVVGDADHIGQAVDALLHNAVKFSPQGGRVEVRVWSEDGCARVSVQDHGVGIPRQFQDKLFRRFYQIDSDTTRRFGGLGLGLALVKEVALAHRGDVWVESQDGQGSCFGFWLPLAEASADLTGG